MLLNFVQEILRKRTTTSSRQRPRRKVCARLPSDTPDLILLDYVLPDMKGDEVLNRLARREPATASVPVVYMSGFGTDLPSDPNRSTNVIGSLNKPFTSELLL